MGDSLVEGVLGDDSDRHPHRPADHAECDRDPCEPLLPLDIRAAIRAMMIANGMIRTGRWMTPRQLAKMEMIARKPATVSDADQRLDGVVP
jgi:hypothetical protein